MGEGIDAKVLRIIDANANRVREGLRVVEEYARFVADDKALTAELKDLRHEVSRILGESEVLEDLVGSRDSASDVGAGSAIATEQARKDAKGVVWANLKRIQEGLRALEEYGKLVTPAMGSEFKRLRFQAYQVEQRVVALLT